MSDLIATIYRWTLQIVEVIASGGRKTARRAARTEFALIAFRRRVAEPAWVYWTPLTAEVRRLPGFKDLVRDAGFVDYWREFGWGDYCRPVGDDDFECE